MTTLDDLARVERELREYVSILESHLYNQPDRASWVENKADTIAAFIAAQRERDADNAKLRAELAAAKAEVEQSDAEYQDAITLAQSNKDRLDVALAEVARLSAACAAKDAALSKALGYVDLDNDALISKCLAALKGTAGTGWIDATGAVETVVQEHDEGGVVAYGVIAPVPDAWAGDPVKIVRVKP